ncbi:MAG TPA: histidine kinase dimerization/phospho-acceptor domain-containing protein, partial [Phycisphaeraceae bacterium]
MPFVGWLSLAIGVVCTALIAAVAALAAAAGETGALAPGLLAALVVGPAVGLIHRLATWPQQAELSRLINHLDAIRRNEEPPAPLRARFGLGPLAKAVEGSLAATRQRLRELIDQKRELEVQLRVAESQRRHLKAILNAMSDAVLVTDAFNEVALANEAAAQVLRFDLTSALRRPVDQVVRDPTLVKLIKDTREGGCSPLRRHVEHRLGNNGQAAVYDVTLACVAGESHGPGGPTCPTCPPAAGVVTILRDVTRQKQIADMKSDFVSSVSHELRTPLSSIKACMEMLIDGEARDEQTRAEFYNIIQSETNRLWRLIDNILNINRIESGVVKVQPEPLPLGQLLGEAVEVMQPQARAKHISLTLQLPPRPCTVLADRDMIHQAVLNLVGNAVKYTPEGGQVEVSMQVDESGRLVRVAVADNGPGVPAQDLPYLFDKFYRVADHKKL